MNQPDSSLPPREPNSFKKIKQELQEKVDQSRMSRLSEAMVIVIGVILIVSALLYIFLGSV